jgi:hypothetical protein
MHLIEIAKKIGIRVSGEIEREQLETLPVMGLKQRLEVGAHGMSCIQVGREVGDGNTMLIFR